MGYFSNATEWEYWAGDNCFRCEHWPKGEDDPGCPVELAHMLYNYELCNAGDTPGKAILDMLIPRKKGCNERCAMFQPKNGVTDQHLKDWAKYKAAMEESTRAINAGAV